VVEIRAMAREDWDAVEAIYAEGIATRQATFETSTPTWDEFDGGRLRRRRERATRVSPSTRST